MYNYAGKPHSPPQSSRLIFDSGGNGSGIRDRFLSWIGLGDNNRVVVLFAVVTGVLLALRTLLRGGRGSVSDADVGLEIGPLREGAVAMVADVVLPLVVYGGAVCL